MRLRDFLARAFIAWVLGTAFLYFVSLHGWQYIR